MELLQILVLVAFYLSLYFITFWLLTFFEKGILTEEKELTHFPNVTVALPVYNEEKNVAKSILSVLALDYPSNKLQVIVVNDGSKDNSLSVIKQLIKEHPKRNILLIDQKNAGKDREDYR